MITKENINVYDIETIRGFFLYSAYDPCLDEWYNFRINQYHNDLPQLLKYLETHSEHYYIGYNNLNFDSQVVDFIWRNQDRLLQLDSMAIAEEIWQFAQDIIEAANHGGFPPYREENLHFKQIDCFKILHGDNENKRGSMSLKHLEYYLDMDIETFDIEHQKIHFTRQEAEDLVYYCHHDIKATYQVYRHLLGEIGNSYYLDNNQIELREQISEEYGINAINFSDSKIGDEIFKLGYCKRTDTAYKDLPKRGTFRKEIKLSEVIPSFISFKTKEFKKLHEKIKSTVLKFGDDFEYTFSYQDLLVKGGEGGIHSKNAMQQFISDEKNKIYTEDVGSYYPALFINTGVCPKHLKKELLVEYKEKYDKRIELKPLAKKDKKINGKVATYKLMLNATFG